MESRTTERFRKSFDILPPKIKIDAKKVFKNWKSDPYHKSLKFKKIHDKENIYSVRIGISWRALGVKDNNTVIWFWIGSHSDYNNLIKSL
jgi:hypothetical protein